MTPLRKKQQDKILSVLKDLVPGVDHDKIYNETLFTSMSDVQWKEWMAQLSSGQSYIPVFVPNAVKTGVTLERCVSVAKSIGLELFQKLWITDPVTGRKSQTPIPRLVVYSPFRRASQTVTKKISVPPNQKTVDAASGQPTGESKGARLSLPELKLLVSMGLDNTATELAKYRGGDLKGYAAMVSMLNRHGNARMDTLKQFASGVESKITMKTFFTAAHLKSNL